MNKIFTLAAAVLLMASCGNGNKAEEIKSAPVDPKATAGMAYVDVDTLQARYQFYIDGKARLEQKMDEFQKASHKKKMPWPISRRASSSARRTDRSTLSSNMRPS